MEQIIDASDLARLIRIREELHRHPELSCKERDTAARVKGFIHPFKPWMLSENIPAADDYPVFFRNSVTKQR